MTVAALEPTRLADLLGARPWLDPAATSCARLPMRPLLVPCPDVACARTVDPARPSTLSSSPWWRDLDGTWDLVHDDGSGRLRSGSVVVPGAWTLQGYDAPHYTNVVMPFDLDPPAVPDRNPIGVYRRSVVVPRDWRGRRVVLRVGGAESFHAVVVDGVLVGYGTDSRLPSEYDLTGKVRPGRRMELAIAVVRFSAQSWVEDQDQWWHGGLQRGVALYSTAPSYLADAALVPGLAPDALVDGPVPAGRAVTGTLDVDVTVDGPALREPGWTVEVYVETTGGRRLATTGPLEVPVFLSGNEALQLYSATHVRPGSVRTRMEVPGVRAWSAESPSRYRALVVLRDPAGATVEVAAQLTGFRHVEVGGRELRINGAPVEIHGVNLHEHDPYRGRAVDAALTRRDLELMKAHQLNAVRAAHYPHDEHLAACCDELGLYLVDEANVESHGRQASLCHDPRYLPTIVERVERMVRRDRNHPSVIVWSLGNESGDGPAHAAAAALVRRLDPSRPVQYEGPLMHDLYADAPVTDIVCPMYTPIDDVVARARWSGDERRPVILCEYSHAMGNSNGSLSDYWDAVEATPGFQGGFIWEWVEHGIPRRDALGRVLHGPDGSPSWAYGGDFGDSPNDGNFVCDGLVSADRRPHPALEEVRHVGRPVRLEVRDPVRGRVRFHNRRWFTDTSDLAASWQLTVDGAEVDGGPLELDPIPPRSAAEVRLPFRLPHAGDGEALVTVTWVQRRRRPGTPTGALVAREQFAPVPAPRGHRVIPAGAGTPVELPVELSFTSTLFRALTDNDAIQVGWMADWSPHLPRWRPLAGGLPEGVDASVRLRPVRGDREGWWRLDARIVLDDEHADVPAVAVLTHLPASFAELEWYGDGPHECYPDRRSAAVVGRWRSTVADQYVPFAHPQEHGFHTGLRWLRLADPVDGVALEVVTAGPTIGFSARHHSDAELFAARHADELTPLERPALTELRLGLQRGLGTGSCGPDTLPRYRLGPGEYRIRVVLRWVRHPRRRTGRR